MAAGTLVSRLTGFVRTMVITAALGAATLGDAWTVAYTLPTMIYILTVGGGLNSVFVPQLVRSMKDDEDGGEAYANRLLTLVMVALGVIVTAAVFIAPLLIQLMSDSIASDPASNNVAVSFARYCLPTIFFMGVHVVMGQILNARGKFGAMMWTPVLNNIVMIFTFGMFLWVYGTAGDSGMTVNNIPPDGIRLLGIGTLLGLVVQALAMIPYLRETGFRFRPRFDWKGHGLGKAVKLAKWTVLFVLANQAGVLVVTQLATAAGKASGRSGAGILAYSNAQLIWGMPQAIITVSVMAAMLPRISRAAHDGDPGAVRDDISQGLRTSAVAIVPVAFMFVALGIPMCTLLFGSSSVEAAQSMGYVLMAFGLGLIPFSVQYVVLRGFYAYEDTRTPSTTRSSWPPSTRPPRPSATWCCPLNGRSSVWRARTVWHTPWASEWPGSGCAGGWAATSTAPACCVPMPVSAWRPSRAPWQAARSASPSPEPSGTGLSDRSRRSSPDRSPCSASSTSQPGRCASKNSTQWSEWSAGA